MKLDEMDLRTDIYFLDELIILIQYVNGDLDLIDFKHQKAIKIVGFGL